MARKYVTVSDLTGKPIEDDADVVTIVLYDHPLIDQPVQLDASAKDVAAISAGDSDYAVFEIISDGGDKTERIVLEVNAFEKLFATDVDDVLSSAEKYSHGKPSAPAQEAPRRGRPAGSSNGGAAGSKPKVNYKELPNSGIPHQGRISPEEKEVVRTNLDVVNKNRVAAGHPAINPLDEADAAKWGFDAQKPEDRPKLSPQFTG